MCQVKVGFLSMSINKIVNSNEILKKYYGFLLLIAVELFFIFIFSFFGDKLYFAVNDNLDSNIALMKVFRDNNCWIDRTSPIPILGGVEREVLNCGYTIAYINYWLFDTQTAYFLNFIESIAISVLGFYFTGISCRKLTGKDISQNMFCVVGILYSLLGFWPSAVIGFSLIPWWALMILELYRTKKWWISLFSLPLLYNISGPLLGVFLIFYSFLFFLIVSVRNKKISREILVSFIIISVIFVLLNSGIILDAFRQSDDTIKSLSKNEEMVYNDSIKQCIKRLRNVLFVNDHYSLYHSDISAFKFTALPVIYFFFVLFNLARKKMKVGKDFLIVYNLTICALFCNAFAVAFDNCKVFRHVISFLPGFSFSRFLWLSPFIISIALILIIHYLCRKGYKIASVCLLLFVLIGIIKEPDSGWNSMYNMIHQSYSINVSNLEVRGEVRWNDYYAPDLFEEIKEDIDYNNEWVVSYAFEPSILQYNGFKTLDGYYSNYSKDYKSKWEKMIMPTLLQNTNAMEYWKESNGQRAYIYSTEWVHPDYGYLSVKSIDMLIDPEILRELGGKYILSNTTISNAEELGFEYLGTWYGDNKVYNIRVYKV